MIRTCLLPDSSEANPAYLTDDALWFIGLYLAEGSMSGTTIQLTGHASEISRLERVQRLAQHYGGTVTFTFSGNKLDIRVYSRILRAVLASYISGKTSHDKALTTRTWRLTNEALRTIMQGYLSGDGHQEPLNARWRLGFTRNYNLERDLRTFAARLGATLTLKPTFSQNGTKRFPAFKGEWRWNRSGHHNEKDRGELMEIRASRARHFWDISVADEPHLFALSSGVLTHNCKPNAMPESVRDRCTRSHEYVFMLSKQQGYFYDADAIAEPVRSGPVSQGGTPLDLDGDVPAEATRPGTRNRRSVWTINTRSYTGAHFATMPTELAERCVLAGSRPGDTVLDPFFGAGTTGVAALNHGRHVLGTELNPGYARLAERRLRPLLAQPALLERS